MITIGKLAALFGITHHQIRYYEDKQLFLPTKIDQNGYRLYDLEAVYQLAQILLLRELDLSVPQINNIQGDYNEDDYQQLISGKIKEIEMTMARLANTKEQLERQLTGNQEAFEKMVELPAFTVKKLLTLKLTEKLTADNLINVVGMNRLLRESLYYLFDEESYHICVSTEEEGAKGVVFPAATYRVHTDYIESEAEADQKLSELSEKYQRFPNFVLERHLLKMSHISKVKTSYYFKLIDEEK